MLRTDGLNLVKCRHNGTSAAEKVFHLVDENTFQWNTGLFSKMKQGIQLSFTTDVRSSSLHLASLISARSAKEPSLLKEKVDNLYKFN